MCPVCGLREEQHRSLHGHTGGRPRLQGRQLDSGPRAVGLAGAALHQHDTCGLAGKAGWATSDYPHTPGSGMEPLLDAIVEHVPTPPLDADPAFRMLVTMIEHDTFLGRIATGRVAGGRVAVGDAIWLLPRAGRPPEPGKVRFSHPPPSAPLD